ncbi:MAG: hypothetical protein RLY93_12535 [Sumerlaeia bacterium]
MRFPSELWACGEQARMASSLAELMAAEPLILTDRLTNSIYFNPPAEALFGATGEELVNRVTFSLLGMDGGAQPPPPAMVAALLGEAGPWKALLHLPAEGGARTVICEASAVKDRTGELICGVIRLSPKEVAR